MVHISVKSEATFLDPYFLSGAFLNIKLLFSKYIPVQRQDFQSFIGNFHIQLHVDK